MCLSNRDTTKIDRSLDGLGPKTKHVRLNYDVPSFISLIKSTHLQYFFNEEVHTMKPGRMTAAVARTYFSGQHGLNSSQCHEVPTWRVLLDSGSNGDLLSLTKDSKSKYKPLPYVTRKSPQSWHTSRGIFCREKRDEYEILFVEFSLSKRIS